MIKQMAWNIFKNTGSIDSYLELVKLEDIQRNMQLQEENKQKEIKNNLGENIGIDTNFQKQ